MRRPLDGLLVVSLEQAVAAPYASCRLADAGARVIKLERPEGDFCRRYDDFAKGASSYFVWLNRGKESCRVDLTDAADRALVQAMLAKADIYIQNLGPGAAERLGFGSARLRAERTCLITCDISGYGDDGPYRARKAYDLLVQAESGLAEVTGPPEQASRVGVSVCDIATGMHAYEAILEALLARASTGEGAAIQVSLFHSMADWMNVPYVQHAYGGKTPARLGLAHPSVAPYGLFRSAEGAGVLISIQNETEWQSFCAGVLDQPALAGDPRFARNRARIEHRAALDEAVQASLGRLPQAEILARLDRHRIAYGRLSTLAELGQHPQHRFVTIDSPGGPLELFAPAARFAGEERRFGPVPALGEHDAALRAEFQPAGEAGAG